MIRLVDNLKDAQFITHAGNFHADDVFATVLLEKIFTNISLIRLKEYHNEGTGLAYDIGDQQFDHHVNNAQKRTDGYTYCSFGLLWQKYGLEYLKRENILNSKIVFEIVDELLVKQIDIFDNGEYEIEAPFNIYTLSQLIELYRPKYGTDELENEAFLKAVSLARQIFDLIIKDAISKARVIEIIKNKKDSIKDQVLILDEYIPYEYALFKLNLDVLFVIYPSNRDGYAAHTVPTIYRGFEPRMAFKKEWAGKRDAELEAISGVKGAKFCHRNLFLVTATTLEGVKQLVAKSRY